MNEKERECVGRGKRRHFWDRDWWLEAWGSMALEDIWTEAIDFILEAWVHAG